MKRNQDETMRIKLQTAQRPFRIEAAKREYGICLERARIESARGNHESALVWLTQARNKSDVIFCLETGEETK